MLKSDVKCTCEYGLHAYYISCIYIYICICIFSLSLSPISGVPAISASRISLPARVAVTRAFVTDAGEESRVVPGSFHEFISRDRFVDAHGVERLDLRFDSGNAQGIFKMTEAA